MPRGFYERDTVTVARELLGKTIALGGRAGRIVEVEAYVKAYLGEIDLAAHFSRGVTPRTRMIFGPPGRAYVYLIYGMHECLNLVTEREGQPGCVLIRALEPLAAGDPVEPMTGPGKLTRALGVTRREHNGADVTRGPLLVRDDGAEPFEIEATPRIGISRCAEWPLRFCVRGSTFLSTGRRGRAAPI